MSRHVARLGAEVAARAEPPRQLPDHRRGAASAAPSTRGSRCAKSSPLTSWRTYSAMPPASAVITGTRACCASWMTSGRVLDPDRRHDDGIDSVEDLADDALVLVFASHSTRLAASPGSAAAIRLSDVVCGSRARPHIRRRARPVTGRMTQEGGRCPSQGCVSRCTRARTAVQVRAPATREPCEVEAVVKKLKTFAAYSKLVAEAAQEILRRRDEQVHETCHLADVPHPFGNPRGPSSRVRLKLIRRCPRSTGCSSGRRTCDLPGHHIGGTALFLPPPPAE